MTDEPISLRGYKNKKKNAQVISDLKSIIHVYGLTISALKLFSKYTIVQETVSVLMANKVLLEISLTKLEKGVQS